MYDLAVRRAKLYSLVLVAVLLGIGAPAYLWYLGGIWRVISAGMIAADVFAVVSKDDGPLTFLWNKLIKSSDGK